MMRVFMALAAIVFALSAPPADAERRVALVIGNGDYAAATALPNPTRDARAVAEALGALGFDVTLGLDLDGGGLRGRLRDFAIGAEGADLALFFYAGHGIQMAGRNYLIPTDAEIRREGDLDLYTLPLDLVVAEMERSATTSIVLLDACRDNPFETDLSRSMGRTRSAALLGRGLAPIETAGGLFVGFATDPGKVAFDGAGDNSPFTEALLAHLKTEGLEINAMMTRVRASVFEETSGRQRPWSTSSLLREVYLAPRAQPAPDQTANDLAAWRAIGEDARAAEYEAYLQAYPEGLFADLARARLEELAATELAALPQPQPKPKSVVPEQAAIADDPAEPAPEARPRTVKDCDICPALIPVAGGDTVLGTDAPDAPAAEKPARAQSIAPFLMATEEITVGLMRQFEAETGQAIPRGCYVWTPDGKMRKNGSAYWGAPGYDVTDDTPASCLNWQDAMRVVEWLNAKVPGAGYRLPSEAEFEFVLKDGRPDAVYPWDGPAEDACLHVNAADAASRFRWRNTACEDGAPDIAKAGAFPANGLGLHDLTGNLWEWTADCWNTNHAGATADGSARLSGQCASRVLRGASWDDPLTNLRTTYRVAIPATQRQANVGFRVVRGDR